MGLKKGGCISPYTHSHNNIYLQKIQRRSPFVTIVFKDVLRFLLFKILTFTRCALAHLLEPFARFVDSTLLMCDHHRTVNATAELFFLAEDSYYTRFPFHPTSASL